MDSSSLYFLGLSVSIPGGGVEGIVKWWAALSSLSARKFWESGWSSGRLILRVSYPDVTVSYPEDPKQSPE